MDLDGAVTYQVSDALRDRHPYSRSAKNVLRAGSKCGNGFGILGLQDSIALIVDDEAAVSEKEAALQHVLRHLSSADTKARLLNHKLLEALTHNPPGSLSVTCDKLICHTLKQLAVLPTAMHALAEKGCIELAVSILETPTEEGTPGAQLAACNALLQMAETWDGRLLLLGLPLPEGFAKQQNIPLAGLSEDEKTAAIVNEEAKNEALGKRLVAALVANINMNNRPLLLSTLKCLGNITTVERGLHFALCESVFRDINQVLEEFIGVGENSDEWIFDEGAVEVIHHAVTVVCNIALDDFGKDRATEIPLVPSTLGKILYEAVKYPHKVLQVKAAVTGAISALFVRAQTKHACLQPLHIPPLQEEGQEVCLAYLLVKLLKQANAIFGPIRDAQKRDNSTPPGATEEEVRYTKSVVTNCNQSIRLLAELPSARRRVAQILKSEPLPLKRQIFYSTQFEAEFLGENFKAF